MTSGRRAILLVGLALGAAWDDPLHAKATPQARCTSAKLKATARQTAAELACQAKAAAKGVAIDAACLAKADAALSRAFTRVDRKGACAIAVDAGEVEALVDPFVDAIVTAEPGGGTKEGGKCAAAKRRAAGRRAAAKLSCQAKAALRSAPAGAACLAKAERAFAKTFGKAEAKGGCVMVGDAPDVEQSVDGFVARVVALLTGTTTTTTTTPGSTTTTPGSPATTTTMSPGGIATTTTTSPGRPVPTTTTPGTTITTSTRGSTAPTPASTTTTTQPTPRVTVVDVGPGVNLVFEPDPVTVHVGDTVRWEWSSSFHNVTSGSNGVADGKFCSPSDTNCAGATLSTVGATYEHTFTQAGTYPYFCTPHYSLGMVGTVVVLP